MREIKFRAWDKDEKRWCQVLIRENGCIANPAAINRWQSIPILMQYTGLKDRNGVEIYEGDIVSMPDPEFKESQMIPYIWEVVYETPLFQLQKKTGFGKVTSNMVRLPMEIIGNIYENPELLSQKGGE